MDTLLDLLQTPIAGRFLVKHVLMLAAVLFAMAYVWRRLFAAPPPPPSTAAAARCACGWRGLVSRHAPRCPRCGKQAFLD